MYLLMYLAETLDYIGRHARVEVAGKCDDHLAKG